MSFTDKEYRILLRAISREREVCERVDKEYVHEPYEVTLTEICDSIERKVHDIQHKYRWHDLRKNPKDLPNEWESVLLTTERHGDVVAYVVATKGLPTPTGWYISADDEFPLCDVGSFYAIAWKEIEPFEVDEE